ncbi:hypothetical protein TMEN_2917 [Trichophyton mentagrophytes]|uniref:Uncharacterized protein n=1 Tax=Trichophyton interdigitale TaxID=101480 RepID=A0A9P5CUJ5_9EURO|nr:hypothetical protein GY631_4294 [Trichophyton interdigitale]KAF3893383.1 hypothetical protein GY632_4235 [Trichophyton interdigitale]KAG8208012.1 hypothetical protein GTR04_4608 [Trichophyton interdigitale]GBF60479.1 hypothetical protein TMEN_2917 [Trichophyton mentagrophytes]
MAYLLSKVTPFLEMVWPPSRKTPSGNGATRTQPSGTPGTADLKEESPSEEEDYVYDINSQLASETRENKDISTGRIPGVAKLLNDVTIGPPSNQTVNRAKPNFYITRPNRAKIPLIPLDELPEGLKLGDQDWYQSCWTRYMYPVSHSRYPSSGTYVATIKGGTQLSRKWYTVRTPSGRVNILKKPKVIPPLLDCCVRENARSSKEDDGVGVQPQENRLNSTQSPLLPQRTEEQIGQRYGTFAPPNSLNVNLLGSSSSSSEEKTAETDGADLPRDLASLTRERSETPPGESQLSMGVLWEIESVDDDDDLPNDEPEMPGDRSDSQSHDNKPDRPEDTDDSQEGLRSNPLRFVNYTLAQLNKNESLRMTPIHDPDEASN